MVVEVPAAPRPIPEACRDILPELPALTEADVVAAPDGELAIRVQAYLDARLSFAAQRFAATACLDDLATEADDGGPQS